MDQAKLFLASFDAGGGGDPGDVIGQSLRFRGAQTLIGPTSLTSTTFTWSGWVKLGSTVLSKDAYIFACTNDTRANQLIHSNNATLVSNGGTATARSTSFYRDPGAWYHFVFSCNAGTSTVFCNGEVVPGMESFTSPALNAPMGIGCFGAALTNNPSLFEGYMADVYFIDGQALEPTVFGRYNDFDVWVPVAPEGLIFGANGFHLDFSDPNDIGADRSPNANNFTPSGFDTSGQVAGGPYNHNSKDFDQVTMTIPTGDGGDPYWIDLVNNPNSPGGTSTEWMGNVPQGWSTGGVTDPVNPNENATYLYGSSAAVPTVNGLTFDLRDFPTVNSVAIWTGWSSSAELGATGAEISLLDADKNIIAGTTQNAIRVDNSLGGTRVELSNTNVGARYIKFDLSAPKSYFYLYGIEVNGQVLSSESTIQPTYDLMADSPTQNWATGNPLYPANQNTSTFADANLGMGTAGNMAYSTQAIYEPCYIEFTSAYTGSIQPGNQTGDGLGFQSAASTSAGGNPAGGSGDYVIARGSGDIVRSAAIIGSVSESWSNGDVMAMTIDEDNIVWYKNNVEIGTFASPYTLSDGVQAIFLRQSPSDNPTINFGQQPFLYTPPEGYEALQTQNMPAATIRNGGDHFRAITGAGDGLSAFDPATQILVNSYTNPSGASSGYSVTSVFDGDISKSFYPTNNTNGAITPSVEFDTPMTGTKFEVRVYTPHFNQFWVNGIAVAGVNGGWVDISAEAAGSLSTVGISASSDQADGWSALKIDDKMVVELGILPQAQQTFPNGLWWIKDRANSNNHQLVDSVRGGNIALQTPAAGAGTAYVAPAGNSVAWCWNAGDAAVTNNDGDVPSQVSANTDAGFSIIQWSGDGSNKNGVGHGLDVKPELIIYKAAEASSNFNVWYSVDGTNTGMFLNTTDAGSPVDTTTWGLPTDKTISNYQTGAGIPMIAYAWHSVPGYSAFGIYQGNNNADGPFIYTGFRPAFIMYKCSTGTGNWHIRDTTRSIYNPAEAALYPNLQYVESVPGNAGNYVDILSNGFKIRNADGDQNQSGQTYIHCAFAENPFSSPVTAR